MLKIDVTANLTRQKNSLYFPYLTAAEVEVTITDMLGFATWKSTKTAFRPFYDTETEIYHRHEIQQY